ncbi:hypothetical protein MGYG_05631 [Nannizzia gypsea CBS 118893]|uniref:Uncharacterized protein n=1 Tax=Arthroderma gypseum (strain ATCC MYA-4604 / CBS 118893) TaxID=535722 RepID=E4UWZ5_ARTGP|nr:hypothetical protein MGYG_05631 [Nannizzia gypsea CBS 118893]EFR02634.1 hypothetical protein MGYG_05631 [Nannizzia gypsea CBS 118893]
MVVGSFGPHLWSAYAKRAPPTDLPLDQPVELHGPGDKLTCIDGCYGVDFAHPHPCMATFGFQDASVLFFDAKSRQPEPDIDNTAQIPDMYIGPMGKPILHTLLSAPLRTPYSVRNWMTNGDNVTLTLSHDHD